MAQRTDDGAGLVHTYQAETGQTRVNVGVNLVVLYSMAVRIFELSIIFISSPCSSFPVQTIPTKYSVGMCSALHWAAVLFDVNSFEYTTLTCHYLTLPFLPINASKTRGVSGNLQVLKTLAPLVFRVCSNSVPFRHWIFIISSEFYKLQLKAYPKGRSLDKASALAW